MNTTLSTTKKIVTWAAAALAALLLLTEAAQAAPAKGDDGGKPAEMQPTGSVNLNTASEDELMLLPGVGPAKAAAIVAWRKKHGGFKKVDDLTRVKGFGRKTLQKLKPHLAVSGATNYRGKKNGAGDAPDPGTN